MSDALVVILYACMYVRTRSYTQLVLKKCDGGEYFEGQHIFLR